MWKTYLQQRKSTRAEFSIQRHSRVQIAVRKKKMLLACYITCHCCSGSTNITVVSFSTVTSTNSASCNVKPNSIRKCTMLNYQVLLNHKRLFPVPIAIPIEYVRQCPHNIILKLRSSFNIKSIFCWCHSTYLRLHIEMVLWTDVHSSRDLFQKERSKFCWKNYK